MHVLLCPRCSQYHVARHSSLNGTSSCQRRPRSAWDLTCIAAQESHRKLAVTTVAVSGLATIALQKSQVFSLRRPQKWQTLAIFGGYPQNRRKLAATTAASRCSCAIARPQRPRDTKIIALGPPRQMRGDLIPETLCAWRESVCVCVCV